MCQADDYTRLRSRSRRSYDDVCNAVNRSCRHHCLSTCVITWLAEVFQLNSHPCPSQHQSTSLAATYFTSQNRRQRCSLPGSRCLHTCVMCLRRRRHPSALLPTPTTFRRVARRRAGAPATEAVGRSRSACRCPCRRRRRDGCASSSRSQRRTASTG